MYTALAYHENADFKYLRARGTSRFSASTQRRGTTIVADIDMMSTSIISLETV